MLQPIAWLRGEIKTPPFTQPARIEAGFLLRRLQQGERFGMPNSRPLPSVGPRCHELRVRDANHNSRILYRVDSDAIVIAAVFEKKTRRLPDDIFATCKRRLRAYDEASEGEAK